MSSPDVSRVFSFPFSCDFLPPQLAEAVPQSMLDECPWGGEMVKVKFYMKCMMKHKVKVCMNYDIKQKLEQHFDSVEKVLAFKVPL